MLSMQLRRLVPGQAGSWEGGGHSRQEISTLEKLIGSRAARKRVIDKDLAEMEKLFAAPIRPQDDS